MAELTTSDLLVYGREVAAGISEGFSPEQICQKFDISPLELEEVFESEEFKKALATFGDEVVNAFRDVRAGTRGESARRNLSENLNEYYRLLNDLATGNSVKPEKRVDLLLALTRVVAPEELGPREEVHMPPSLIDNWAKRHHEYESACRAHRRYMESESRETGGTGNPPQEVPRDNRRGTSTAGS
jgi:hypothetical protein